MFPFNSVDAVTVDVVPSAVWVVLMPLCEGVAVGLLLGAALLFAMGAIERLLAQHSETQPTDAQPATNHPAGARPAIGARMLPARSRRPATQRRTLLARLA